MKLNDFALQELSPYQNEDSDFVAANRRVVLGHKTGMGKSLIALAAATKLGANKILVCGGTSAALTWETEPFKWCDTQTSFLNVAGHSRPKVWRNALESKEGVWFCTYESLGIHMEENPKHPKWDLVIGDELHKLRSRKTRYKTMKQVEFKDFIGASATWASRGPQDLWTVLNLFDRRKFSSYWAFVHEYCYVEDTGFGKEIFGVRNKEKLKAILYGQYFRTRTWAEIGKETPPIRRVVLELDMDIAQRKVYNELDTESMVFHGDESVIAPTKLAKLTRMHQLAAFPSILFPSLGIGPGLSDIIRRIEDDPHTVIYTYFSEAIPLIEAAVRNAGHKNVYSMKGGIKLRDIDILVGNWKATKGIMICSIKFAESFRLDTSHTAYVLSFSWDPDENIQAEGRLRAVNSTIDGPAIVYYYIIRGTVMEAVREVTNEKAMTVSQIFHDYSTIRRTR